MSKSSVPQQILRCALEAGARADAGDSANDVSSESDRQWLQNTLNDIASSPTLVDILKGCIEKLKQGWEEDLVPGSSNYESVKTCFEQMSNLCEDIDLACDLHKLGGFPVVIKYLNHTDNSIQTKAADLIAIVAQNNEYCQTKLLELKILNQLLPKIGISDNCAGSLGPVAVKAVYAVSCIVRQNQTALEQFVDADGFSCLIKGMQSTLQKLQLKCVFLLRSICEENLKCHNVIHDMGFVVQLAAMLKWYDNADITEFILDIFLSVASKHDDFQKSCKDQSLNLEKKLGIIADESVRNERDDIKAKSMKLFKLLLFDKEDIER
ncbi:hsp70-binding protein 1-like isoform X1 [Clavelina lepadiformis]|uniref:hsp70-binding protein 1-like isoform X1 n=1 Tax=Clavelina lepadiformis TaxID=159417 RepID=UPI004042C4D8